MVKNLCMENSVIKLHLLSTVYYRKGWRKSQAFLSLKKREGYFVGKKLPSYFCPQRRYASSGFCADHPIISSAIAFTAMETRSAARKPRRPLKAPAVNFIRCRSNHIMAAVLPLGLASQLLQGDPLEKVVDQLVQPFPHRIGGAPFRPGTGGSVLPQARNRRQGTLRHL